jgi:hypothetical protein
MRRHPILWSLIAAYLLVVGVWPAAATPVGLAFAGAGVVLAAIPLPVLALVGVVGWELLQRLAPKTSTA